MSVTLSRDQNVALSRIGRWIDGSDKFFVLDGPAGSGKTELARRIGDGMNTIFCSLTGKAANVLRSRGMDASTLHRSLYRPTEKSRDHLNSLLSGLITLEKQTMTPEIHKKITSLRAQINEERRRTRSPSWSVPEEAPIKEAELVVIDEYSMLDARIVEDLHRHAQKVLFLGDPFQLPPVKGVCPLAGRANYTLTEVHRQALESPILRAVTAIRQGGKLPPSSKNDFGEWEYVKRQQTSWAEHFSIADQLIVARNQTRGKFNARFRNMLGFRDLIEDGERIIFGKNNHDLEIYNGTTARVMRAAADSGLVSMEVVLDDGRNEFVDVWDGVFRGEEAGDAPREALIADYGYAITCHKAQGSEYNHVAVWNEGLGGVDIRRWMYTAASRAKQRCTFIEVN